MATLRELYSHPGAGATAVEYIESRRGGGDVVAGEAQEERIYGMQFTDTTWTTADALYATGVPAFGAQLGNKYCTEKYAEPDPGDQTVVKVRAIFKTLKPSDRAPHINATTPIWSIAKTISQFPTEEVVDRDLAGKICVNVLGERMQPPVTKLIYDDKITIKFLTNTSGPQYYAWITKGCVNSYAYRRQRRIPLHARHVLFAAIRRY
jgi:hypothetical protein